MTLTVLLNTVVLVLDLNDDVQNIDYLSICNFVFTGIFTIEMILKITAYGFKKYFKDFLNSMDAFIVTMSLVEFMTTFGIV
jgi:voltage-gated cation channel